MEGIRLVHIATFELECSTVYATVETDYTTKTSTAGRKEQQRQQQKGDNEEEEKEEEY